MPDLPKAGERWFKRDTHAVVIVLRLEMIGADSDGPGVPHKVWLRPDGEHEAMFWRDPENFLRDYRRDEPITLELLEGTGWEIEGTTASVRTESGGRLQWGGVIPFCHIANDPWYIEGLATPATLRDLLQILKVFGIPVGAKGIEVGR